MILVSLVNWVVLRLIYKYFILKNQLNNFCKVGNIFYRLFYIFVDYIL